MSRAYAASDARIALDTIVARLNIERFCKMFCEEADETKRQILANLITMEKAKLDALTPRASVAGRHSKTLRTMNCMPVYGPRPSGLQAPDAPIPRHPASGATFG
jgi:hypothetical protein